MTAWACSLGGSVRYSAGVELQERLWRARLEDRIPDTVLFLEHAPVITLGRRGRRNFLVASESELQTRGVDLVQSSRGGDVTFHGPGQLVMYPILKLGTSDADAHGYLHNLEEIAIRTADSFRVKAFRRAGMNGAWTEAGKISAIGFAIKRWVTMHGLSFNVDLDLAGFGLIVGCGLVGERVSSLKELLGANAPPVDAVRDVMSRHFETVMRRPLTWTTSAELTARSSPV